MNLFRPEVAAARRVRLGGTVLLSQPVTYRVLTALLVMCVALSGAYVSLGSYTRTEPLRGFILAKQGAAKLYASRPGMVSEVLVADGDMVHAGQRLLRISQEQSIGTQGKLFERIREKLTQQERIARQQLAQVDRELQQERERLQGLTARLDREIESLNRELSLRRATASELAEQRRKLEAGGQQGYVAKNTLDDRTRDLRRVEIAVLERSTALERLRSERAELSRTLANLPHAFAAQRLAARDRVLALQIRHTELEAQAELVVTAPVDGIVSGLQAAAGQRVTPELMLASIDPLSAQYHAVAYVPVHAAGDIKPGQSVRIRYDAFGQHRFGLFEASVHSLSATVLAPQEIGGPLRVAQPAYRLILDLAEPADGADAQAAHLRLRSGMTFTAFVKLEERRLVAALLDPRT